MPIKEHSSFNRPPDSTKLWRYTDLSKFVDLLTSKRLWLTNAEILASDDPHEGLHGALQFPHRIWKCLEDLPEKLRAHLLQICAQDSRVTPQDAFKSWFAGQEQSCLMALVGRRNFYVNCWHAADYESVAMWKIYGTPGAGVTIITNGSRLETALSQNSENMHLGAMQYWEPDTIVIGTRNSFDPILVKRASYLYEKEVRLVYWDTNDMHDPFSNFSWNDEKMRFDNSVEDTRPLKPGISLPIDIDVLIEEVVISPTAPSWYAPMVERLKEQLNFKFLVTDSTLLNPPSIVP